ncbi:CPBP family intramembrane metalloprotease [bacterium]|nr:CPBP family intramembrane metalloprotease [bacterium]
MRTIIGYLKAFHKDHLNGYDYIFAFVYTALFAYLNYGTDFIDNIANEHRHSPEMIVFHMVLYGIPFLIGYLFSAFNHKDTGFLKNQKFWFLFFFALLVFALRSNVNLLANLWWDKYQNIEHSLFYYRIICTVLRAAIVFGVIWIYWIWSGDRRKYSFYGFTLKKFSTKPYFAMLLLMLPLIVVASTQADFLGAYPRGANFQDLDINNPDHKWYFIIYEIFYGSDFLNVEFFFRGFLILAFLEVAGPRVLLPMALFYCTIHWGKPAGELVSSLFGGSILGIVTYYSRSIIGGIIVHVGIAWLMELGALIGNMYN